MDEQCAQQGDDSVEEKYHAVSHPIKHRRIRFYDDEWHKVGNADRNACSYTANPLLRKEERVKNNILYFLGAVQKLSDQIFRVARGF